MPDILSILHAVEADRVHRLVGARARHLQRVAEGGHAENAPAVGDDALAFRPSAGMEDVAILGRPGQAGDLVAFDLSVEAAAWQ